MKIPEKEYILEDTYNRTRYNYLNSRFPEFCKYLLEIFPNDISFNEKLYWYYNNINTYPVCSCGNSKRLKYYDFIKGYHRTCGAGCSNYQEIEEKTKKTKLERYGDCNYNNHEQTKITNINRYGCECSLCSKEIKEKAKETCLKRYGVDNPFACPEIIEKNEIPWKTWTKESDKYKIISHRIFVDREEKAIEGSDGKEFDDKTFEIKIPGKDSDYAFAEFFRKALSKTFGNYIYEKDLKVYLDGNYARAEYPLVKGREREFTLKKFEPCLANFIDELGDCNEPYYAYEGKTHKNDIDDEDEQVPIRSRVYLNNKVPMWKNHPYFFIGVFKDDSTDQPAWLCIDADPEQIKKLYKK